MHEFELIEKYFNASRTHRQDVVLGIGDDCALLHVPADMTLAVSMDTLVSGVHFPMQTDPFDIGHKALAVNLSDLAAMGATPAWATLALTMLDADPAWLEAFARGFFSLAHEYNVELIGGDTTRGPLSITVQVHGLVPQGQAIKRSGAKPGDLIVVTGDLGLAGWALQQLQQGIPVDPQALQKLNRPQPRIHEAIALRGIANAIIDISDGLAADLTHIAEASQCGATVWVEKIPLHPNMQQLALQDALTLALTAGDDYELCFTVPPEKSAQCHGTIIGEITKTPGIKYLLNSGVEFNMVKSGYEHFRK